MLRACCERVACNIQHQRASSLPPGTTPKRPVLRATSNIRSSPPPRASQALRLAAPQRRAPPSAAARPTSLPRDGQQRGVIRRQRRLAHLETCIRICSRSRDTCIRSNSFSGMGIVGGRIGVRDGSALRR
jgi:hypothetical protein